jgi:hypothetical protein
MRALATLDSDIIPGFDVLEWKREIQEEIYQETKGMTSDEFLEYLRRGSVEFREEMRQIRAERAALFVTDQ